MLIILRSNCSNCSNRSDWAATA